jgi:adenine-specific DNA-methyltransferase
MLRAIGIETSNIYTGFLSVVLELLDPKAEMVAVTPRSSCNGTYFKRFRKQLLEALAIDRIHVFESRQVVFREDNVCKRTSSSTA